MENNKKHDNDNEFVYIIIAVAVIAVIAALLSYAHEKNANNNIQYTTSPTAGVTYYMGRLQYWSLQMAEPDMDVVEAAVTPVAVPMESDIPETEEEVIEEEPTGEDLLNAYFGYTPDDAELELWTQLVMDECGHTEPDEGVAAVADVVANRVRSSRFPNTIRGVIYQTGQFQPVGDGTFGRFYITDRVREICSECICEGVRYSYLFFTAGGYNSYCKPGEVIGNHYFGY